MWHYGEKVSARRHNAQAQAQSQAQKPSSGPLINAVATNAAGPKSLRLSNTRESITQLLHDDHAILLRNAIIDTSHPFHPDIPAQLRSKGAPGSYIVQFDRPLNREFYDSIKKDGAAYVSYIPNNAALVKADADVAKTLEADPMFQAVLPYEPYYKLDNTLLASAVAQTPQTNVLSVTTFAGQGDAALKALTDLGAKLVGRDQGPFGPILVVSAPPQSVAAIAQLPLAQEVEAYAPRHMANDLTRVQLGITTDTLRATSNYLNLDGTGVTVNLNDTGVDGSHPDFSGGSTGVRLTGAVNDPDGHGTHVAGIIIGNGDAQAANNVTAAGSLPNADFRGKATNASLFVQSVELGFVGDSQLESNASVALGSSNVISANSWNYGTPEYDMHAASFDAATRDAQPMVSGQQPLLFVFAAGNVGGVFGSDADNGIDGQADSIWSPGTAKNVITVGATDSPRFITNEVSYDLTNTNQVFFGSTDNSNLVAWFSSCGNVGVGIEGRYGRFKPDVVAPGVFIVSCRATNYVDPTNEEFVTVIPVTNQTVLPGKTNYYPMRIFSDTSEAIASVTPNDQSPTPFPGLRILSDVFTPPKDIVATNFVAVTNLPKGITPLGTNWYFGITTLSNQAQPVAYDLTLYDVETNSLGDYFQVLSNMNKTLYPSYMYQSGTSMAAGAVAGTLALMQEFLEKQTTNAPSPALLKALLINGSRSINLLYDFNPQTTGANEQGWGMPNITNCIPASLTNSTPSMVYVDQSTNDALATGQSQTYTVTATDSNNPVRITLVWTDPPGDPAAGVALVNNLALTVVDAATNVYVGNDFFSGDIFTEMNTGDASDSVNNVQNVFIDGTFTPIAFPLTVTVSGLRVNVNAVPNETNQIAQDYALVISSDDTAATLTVTSNAIVNPLPPVPLVTVASNGVPLLHQRVGANEPNAYNHATGATNGTWQQWHFFEFTNYALMTNNQFTNLVFMTFQPPNLAVPRASGQADIDMYVSTDPLLLQLDKTALASARKSLTQEGTEFVVVTNDSTDFAWFIGIKSEDQQAADFGFFAEAQTNPFASGNPDGSITATGIVVPQPINDAATTATLPVFAIFPQPLPPGEGIRKVEVNLTISHGNPADLFGTLTHDGIGVVLNHFTGPPGGFTNVYDDLDESATAGTQHSDGPGSLTQYIGESGAAAEGVWELQESDNAVAQNGQISLFNITVSPQPLGLVGIAVTPPNSWTKYFLNVPTDATNMIIVATNFSGAPENIGIFMTNYADLELFDYGISNDNISAFPPALGSILTTNLNTNPPVPPAAYPPLAGGVWYWGIYNFGSATVTNNWGIIFQSSQTPNLVQTLTNNTPTPLETDGTTQSQLCVTEGQQVLDLSVGVRINDTNLDDLVLRLISPQGTSVLLFENRGGTNASALGLGSSTTTNLIYTVFTDDTNLTTTPIKFAPQFANSNGVSTSTVLTSDNFDNVAAKTYTNGQQVGNWTVASNQVGVFNERSIAHSGVNFLALTSGRITNTFATVPGAAYELQYYARPPGLTDWWPGDDNALDIVGTNNGVALGVTNDVGEVNRAFTFGGNDSVSFGTSAGNVGTNDFSVDFWVKSTYTAGLMALLEKRPVCSYLDSFFGFRLNRGGVVTYEQSADGIVNSANVSTKKSVADGLFHHVAMTRNGTIISLYVDGVLDSATTSAGITVISNNVPFYAGKAICYQNGDSTQEFVGDLDEIDLWSRALSPAEVEAIFEAGSAGKYNATSLYPNFQVSVDGYSTNTIIITNFTGGWQSFTNSFIPTNSQTTIELSGNTLSTLFDDIQVLKLPGTNYNNYFLPEEPLTPFIGEYPQGCWTLEVLDTRTDSLLTNNGALLSWNLQMTSSSTNVNLIVLTNRQAFSNAVAANSISYYAFDVPSTANFATNILSNVVAGASGLNLLFNQTALPTGTLPGDVTLLNGVASQNADTLSTQGAPPTLVPGSRYFLGVQNTGNSTAKFTIEVDTDVGTNSGIIALTNQVPLATTNNGAKGPDYYSFSVPADAVMLTFQILNPQNAEVDLYARDGLPVPAPFDFDYDSRNTGPSDQFIVVTTNSAPLPLPAGLPSQPPSTWYLSVNPATASDVTYTIVATCVTNAEVSRRTLNTNILNIITLTTNTFFKTATPGYPSNYVYSFAVPGNPAGLQFTVTNISGAGNLQLLAQNGTFPTPAQSYIGSFNPGAAPQVIAFGTNANLPTLTNTTWYLAVYNTSTNSINYSITATNLATVPVTTVPLFLGSSVSTAANQFTLNWDATPGSNYTVQVSTNLTTWSTVTNITAQSTTITYTDSVPVNTQNSRFFRILGQ